MTTNTIEQADIGYRRALLNSVFLHIIIVVIFAVNFEFGWKTERPVVANVIDAVVIDSGILEEVKPPKPVEDPKKQEQQRQQQRLQEQQRIQQQEAQRKAAAEQEKQRQAAEKLRLAKEKEKKKEAAEKKRREEEQRKREAEAAEQRRQELLAEEQRMLQEAQQQEWDELRAAEEAAAAQARSNELASKRALYIDAIAQKVERNWIKPASAQPEYECRVNVQQLPGGEVVNVKITSCNADAVFERSVENAVYKASPLPSPPDPGVFDRNLSFRFAPKE